MSSESAYPEGFSEQDILFDCPQCTKSLGIHRRGAGLVVRCPDCGARMRVPVTESKSDMETSEWDESREVFTGLSETERPDLEETVHRLEVSIEEFQRRKDYLERLRFGTEQHIERLREEMAVIQASLDRMVDILQAIVPEQASDDD